MVGWPSKREKVRLPCQVGANVSRVERGACRDIRVRDRARLHAERRDALGWNKREIGLKRRRRLLETRSQAWRGCIDPFVPSIINELNNRGESEMDRMELGLRSPPTTSAHPSPSRGWKSWDCLNVFPPIFANDQIVSRGNTAANSYLDTILFSVIFTILLRLARTKRGERFSGRCTRGSINCRCSRNYDSSGGVNWNSLKLSIIIDTRPISSSAGWIYAVGVTNAQWYSRGVLGVPRFVSLLDN